MSREDLICIALILGVVGAGTAGVIAKHREARSAPLHLFCWSDQGRVLINGMPLKNGAFWLFREPGLMCEVREAQ